MQCVVNGFIVSHPSGIAHGVRPHLGALPQGTIGRRVVEDTHGHITAQHSLGFHHRRCSSCHVVLPQSCLLERGASDIADTVRVKWASKGVILWRTKTAYRRVGPPFTSGVSRMMKPMLLFPLPFKRNHSPPSFTKLDRQPEATALGSPTVAFAT